MTISCDCPLPEYSSCQLNSLWPYHVTSPTLSIVAANWTHSDHIMWLPFPKCSSCQLNSLWPYHVTIPSLSIVAANWTVTLTTACDYSLPEYSSCQLNCHSDHIMWLSPPWVQKLPWSYHVTISYLSIVAANQTDTLTISCDYTLPEYSSCQLNCHWPYHVTFPSLCIVAANWTDSLTISCDYPLPDYSSCQLNCHSDHIMWLSPPWV